MSLIDRVRKHAIDLELDLKVVEVCDRIVNDEKPKLQLAYLFAETGDNQDSVFHSAGELQQSGLAQQFLVIGSEGAENFLGYSQWTTFLKDRGNIDAVTAVPIDGKLRVNTLNESVSLLNHVNGEQNGLYIVASYFHQLRAFMNAASIALGQRISTPIFNYIGRELPWEEKVMHSQGRGLTRDEWLRQELITIGEYQLGGLVRIASFQDVLRYMDQRRIPGRAE